MRYRLYLGTILLLASLCVGLSLTARTDMPEPAPELNYEAWLIVPGERVGKITAETTYTDLAAAYGAQNLEEGQVYAAEGNYDPGTIVFPNEPLKRLEIVWQDPQHKARPGRIELTGDRSLWHTADGISLGTTVHSLELLNGKPFTMLGFGWDYGGWINGWEEGKLEQTLGYRLSLRLQETGCRANELEWTDFERDLMFTVSGDGVTPASDLPAIRLLNPCVTRMVVNFE